MVESLTVGFHGFDAGLDAADYTINFLELIVVLSSSHICERHSLHEYGETDN